MRADVITIFPGMFPGPLAESIVGRALERGVMELVVHDLRDYAEPPHRQVDDQPFGGGGGMVLKPEPLFAAVEDVRRRVRYVGLEPGPVILLSPQGERLRQGRVEELSRQRQLTLICGRYEGVDERVCNHLVDLELSIGDYVVSGGELPAMVLVDALSRLQPEALGDEGAARRDSFSEGLLDYPQYTRPASFRGMQVPEVLRSGDHRAIARWRRQQALVVTARKRPDLLAKASLSPADRRLLQEAQGDAVSEGSGSLETGEGENGAQDNPRRALVSAGGKSEE